MVSRLDRLRKRHRGEESDVGFTLIELLIVVVILGILAAIVVFAVQNLSGQSAQSACQSDVRTVESALELYRAQTGVYPGGNVNTGVQVQTASTYTFPGSSALTGPDGNPFNKGIDDLLSTYTINGQTIGPWLKEAPFNSTHYEIWVSSSTVTTSQGPPDAGSLEVYKPDSSASIPATNPQGSTADCSSVS